MHRRNRTDSLMEKLYGWYVNDTLIQESLTLSKYLDFKERIELNIQKHNSEEVKAAVSDMYSCAWSIEFSTRSHPAGSRAEGVSTFKSDLDLLREILHVTATEDAFSSQDLANTDNTVFYIHTDNTSPGHCMLELIKQAPYFNEITTCLCYPCFHCFGNQRFISSFAFKCVHSTLESNYIRSSNFEVMQGEEKPRTGWRGPAINVEFSHLKFDTVYGVRMAKWPKQSLLWLKRERKYGWPSSDLLESVKEAPVFVVPAGLKGSPNEDLEWTFAFNLIELPLVRNFNVTQRRCYKLLKHLTSTYITPLFGDDIISSYCLKNLMFWCIEDSPQEIWQPKYLVSCIQMCLHNLLLMVNMKDGPYCPNYFIPEKNLFLGKVGLHHVTKLIAELDNVLLQTFDCVLHIPELDLAFIANLETLVGSPNLLHLDNRPCGSGYNYTFMSLIFMYLIRELELQEAPTFETVVMQHQTLICKLKEILLKENCVNELQDMLTTVVSSLGLHCVSLRASIGENTDFQDELDQYGKKWLLQGCERSVGASMVKLALYFMHKWKIDEALEWIDTILEGDVQTFSFVVPLKLYSHIYAESIKQRTGNFRFRPNDESPFKTPNNLLDTIYLPGEIYAVPSAIKIEMFKPFQRNVNFVSNICRPYRNWVVCDPVANALLLQFLCYRNTGHRLHMFRSLRKFKWLCTKTINRYRTSSLNLLGYCHLQMGLKNRGIQIFLRSITLDQENAAYWHLAIFAWKEILNEWKET